MRTVAPAAIKSQSKKWGLIAIGELPGALGIHSRAHLTMAGTSHSAGRWNKRRSDSLLDVGRICVADIFRFGGDHKCLNEADQNVIITTH